MAKGGTCKLCGQSAKLIKAHIAPNSFYQPCLSAQGHALLLRTEGYTSTLSTGIYDPELVCEKCERLFSPWDSYAKELLLDFDWGAAIWSDLTSPGVVKEQYDYPKLKLFFLSITWRMAATMACPPNPDPVAMRAPMDPGRVQEALEDEADEAHTGTDRDQAA
jgi:hypothetical protein